MIRHVKTAHRQFCESYHGNVIGARLHLYESVLKV